MIFSSQQSCEVDEPRKKLNEHQNPGLPDQHSTVLMAEAPLASLCMELSYKDVCRCCSEQDKTEQVLYSNGGEDAPRNIVVLKIKLITLLPIY